MYLFLILIAFIFLFLVTFVYAGWKGAPWVPTRRNDVKRFLKIAKIQQGQKVYDLGSGDGRIVYAAAQAGAKAEGFEISLFPYLLSQARLLFLKNKEKYKIKYKDFWHVNLDDADIVYFFLMPKVYHKLKIKFEKELKKGTKVIAYVWPIDDWKSLRVDAVKGQSNLYLYQI